MWYVIQTKPREEDRVSKRFELANLNALNAKIKTAARGLRPLFPNYIFLKCDLTRAENIHMVKYTRGVNKILGTAKMPVPISDEVIDLIMERLNKNSTLEEETMKAGSRVKVKRGLLKDLEGILEKSISADGRVAVLLRIHQREMRAMLHCKEVALVA